MLRVHKFNAFFLENIFERRCYLCKSTERQLAFHYRLRSLRDDLLDVIALFHGDESGVIFFVDPDEDVLIVVVENT